MDMRAKEGLDLSDSEAVSTPGGNTTVRFQDARSVPCRE
jgi:hypothetical protein